MGVEGGGAASAEAVEEFKRGVDREYGIEVEDYWLLAMAHYRAASNMGLKVASSVLALLDDRRKRPDAYRDALAASGLNPEMSLWLARIEKAKRAYDMPAIEDACARIDTILELAVANARIWKASIGRDLKTALGCCTEIANSVEGYIAPKACSWLGQAYARGEGYEENWVEAVKYLKVAAASGDAVSQRLLGIAYDQGSGVDIDHERAVELFTNAADSGDGEAKFHLACSYYLGRGVNRDLNTARRWAEDATASGDRTAGGAGHYILGLIYENERDAPSGFAEAYRHYRQAARLGIERAGQRARDVRQKTKGLRIGWKEYSLLLLCACFLAALLIPSKIPVESTPVLWAAVLDSALLALYFSAPALGYQSRRRIAERFLSALKAGAFPVRIGGALWVTIDQAFWRASYVSDRGALADPASSLDLRETMELSYQRLRGRCVAVAMLVPLAASVASASTETPAIPVVSVISLLVLAATVALEVAYRAGFQLIPGAMALDPDPQVISRAEVESQKAHGDADLTKELEAVQMASRKSKSSRLEDREF